MSRSLARWIGTLPVRWRGLLIIALPVILFSIIIVVVAYLEQKEMLRRAALDRANSIVDSISRDAEKIITLGSRSASVELADRLRAFPMVEELVLYDDDARGSYAYRHPELPPRPAPAFSAERKAFGSGRILLIKSLNNRHGRFGYARIQMHTDPLGLAEAAAWRWAGWILIGLAVLGIAVAFFLHWFIVRPVVALSHFVQDVTEKNDYGLRLRSRDQAELGTLRDGIHDLLEHIRSEHERITTLNRELRRTTERAEQASRAKSRFLAHMSHELRTPLNGVVGIIELLRNGQMPADEIRQHYDIAYLSCRHLMAVINDTLELSRIDDGGQELENEPFGLRELVTALQQMMSATIADKEIEFRSSVAHDVPDCLRGDGVRLLQILMNLVGNASRCTGPGDTIELTVSRNTDRRGATGRRVMLHFVVRDTGIGISKEAQATIFDPYTQADEVGVEHHDGSGLGLAIAARLVRLMGGTISVESEKGQGSVFRFTVPVRVCRPESKSEADDIRVHGDAAVVPPLRILLVDDNRINLKVARRLLAVDGHQVESCENGAEAVEAVERERFDVVLMDVNMPVMDGRTATRMIRERERETGGHVTIIAVTASALSEDVAASLASGMDDCIGKPVNLETMRTALMRNTSNQPAGRGVRT